MITIDLIKWFGKQANRLSKLGFYDVTASPGRNGCMMWRFNSKKYQINYRYGYEDCSKHKTFVFNGDRIPLDINENIFNANGKQALELALNFIIAQQEGKK